MDKDFIKLLDTTLQFLNKNRKHDGITDQEIMDGLFNGERSFDYRDVISQLSDDNYLHRQARYEKLVGDQKQEWVTILNHKGRLFIEMGGYEKQFQKVDRENKKQKLINFSLIFGGVAAGCYYTGCFLNWVLSHFDWWSKFENYFHAP